MTVRAGVADAADADAVAARPPRPRARPAARAGRSPDDARRAAAPDRRSERGCRARAAARAERARAGAGAVRARPRRRRGRPRGRRPDRRPASAARSRFARAARCSSLRPVSIGQNSFVYAADGIAARLDPGRAEPPARARCARSAPGCRKGDRRDRGPALLPARRRRLRGHRARALRGHPARARSSQGGSTITQQLVRNLYISRERTLKRKLKEACLAIKLAQQLVEGQDPRRPT